MTGETVTRLADARSERHLQAFRAKHDAMKEAEQAAVDAIVAMMKAHRLSSQEALYAGIRAAFEYGAFELMAGLSPDEAREHAETAVMIFGDQGEWEDIQSMPD